MTPASLFSLLFSLLVFIFVVVAVFKAFKIVPQGRAVIIERLGRYSRTLEPGLHFLVPFLDRVVVMEDLREQVVTFPPQPVITRDNLVVSIDSVIYFSVHNPSSANYEIADYLTGIEQLTITTLRNVIGSLDLEQTLTSRDEINSQLRGVLDGATSQWGIRVNRVEIKAIDPPASVQEAMEKQMRAEREKRAQILQAEAYQQSTILTAEGDKQSQILNAEGKAASEVLKARGQAQAVKIVNDAVREADLNEKMLTYQYLQQLPYIANGASNKVWFIPSEVSAMVRSLGNVTSKLSDNSLSEE